MTASPKRTVHHGLPGLRRETLERFLRKNRDMLSRHH